MSVAGAVAVRAYAKVNLCLAVSAAEPAGGPRTGWHRIASWFAPVELWDDVFLERRAGDASGSTYVRAWGDGAVRPRPIDWPEERDLAVRAHRLLEQHTGRALPIEMRVVKRIPTGAGLGGGSSDAAAVLRGVDALFDLGLGARALRGLSARLGSDVAYFIPDGEGAGRLDAPPPGALVLGFGDEIRSARTPHGAITLIVPDFECPTASVYRAFDERPAGVFREAEAAELSSPTATGPIDPGSLFNDLWDGAVRVAPGLAGVASALQGQGHAWHLSGSGRTLFVLGSRGVRAPAGCVALGTRFA